MQWVDVLPHVEFQELLARKVDAFWDRVQRREPPDPDGSEASRRALCALYPNANDEVVRLESAADAMDEYQRNAEALKALKARQDTIRNQLASVLQESKYAVLDDGRYWVSSAQEARDVSCPHCSEVLSHRAAFRTYSLRNARKKPFPEPVRTASLPAPEPQQDA